MAPKRDKNGRFKKGQTGNPNGRPKKPYKERLLAEIEAWEKDNDKSYLAQYVLMGATDAATMRDIQSKFIPSLKQIDIPVPPPAIQKFSFNFVEYDGRGSDPDKA